MTYTPRSSIGPDTPTETEVVLPTSLPPGMLLTPLTLAQMLPQRLPLQLGELLEQLTGFFRQDGRHSNFDRNEQVAPGTAPRTTASPDAEGFARLGARR